MSRITRAIKFTAKSPNNPWKIGHKIIKQVNFKLVSKHS